MRLNCCTLSSQGFTCPADSGQVCGITPNPAGSNLNYGYQGFDNFAMLSLVVFQVRLCWQQAVVDSAITAQNPTDVPVHNFHLACMLLLGRQAHMISPASGGHFVKCTMV